MEERRYQVQEAVRLIGVESHVLRYWEEELGITVGRTKQGYRLYSEENIRLFRQVKELKEQGIGLKAIRLLLGGTADGGRTGRDRLMESLTQTGAAEHGERGENQQEAGGMEKDWKRVEKKTDRYDRAEDGQAVREENEDHLEYEVITNESETMAEFERILKRIIREAVADQNEKLELAVTELIQEELEVQLDAILDAMREAVAEREETKGGLWKRIRQHWDRKNGHPFSKGCPFCSGTNYSAEIAPVGQAASHVPHSRQTSASMTYFPSPSEIASAGHSLAHVPQATHSSEITYAMILSSFYNDCLSESFSYSNTKREIMQCLSCISEKTSGEK